MSPRCPDIIALEWDDVNEDHILRHIDPDLVDEMVGNGDWHAFANTSGHPPERVKIIGRTADGAYVTAILTPSTAGDFGIWKPVTAWHSSDYERDRYHQSRRQGGR